LLDSAQERTTIETSTLTILT